MKVETKVGNVVLSDNLKVHKFRVKINSQSYKLLYGDLYSDPISAIIRELSTNANDSHVFAGKPETPFEVHLPNDLEPYFYVKDFGTGLSPDQICGEDGIYITFCDSNKTHSDDVTGALGLGSKSPLAYTDNFTVESVYNGIRYSYAVFMDESGEPCITELGSVPTDDPNGLKVEMAVKESDFNKFSGKAAEVLCWFKVKPHVVGDAEFTFAEHVYLRKTDRYAVRKDNDHESHVIMGNVAYPINTNNFSYNKIDDIERAVLEYGVDLFVDMGDVEFVPSREQLRYTDKTVAGVKKYMKDVIASIREELEKQVLSQPTMWKARRMMNDVKHSILGKVKALTTVIYNGKEIAEYINFHKTVAKTMPFLVDNTDPLNPKVDRLNPAYPKLEVLSKRKEHYRRNDEETLHCNGNKIYFNDMERGGFTRIHHHVRNGIGKPAYMITGVDAKFFEETGIDEVMIRASTLPQPEPKQRIKRSSDGVKGYVKRTVLQEYTPSGGNYMTNWWQDVEVDVRDGGVYVVCSYGQIAEGESKTLPSEIKKRYNAIKELRPDFKLMGIRPAHMGRIEKYKHRWVKFDDFADEVFKTELNVYLEKLQLIREWAGLENKDRYMRFVNQVFSVDSLFGQFMDKFREAKSAKDDAKASAMLELNGCVKSGIEMEEEAFNLNKLGEALETAYPMMQYLEWFRARHEDFVTHFSDYVRVVDAMYQPLAEAV